MISFVGDRLEVHFREFGIDSYKIFLRCKQLPEYEINFDKDSETYTITAPARFASMLGVASPAAIGSLLPFCKKLYDDQAILVSRALEAKRFAIWSQCGNGKTPIGLEWARQVQARTNGRVLIVTFKEIVQQWIDETAKFYGADLKIIRLNTREEMREWCKTGAPGLAITNYEKFNPESIDDQTVNECRHLAGIVLDESSRLKSGGGKQKWALIKSCKGIEYKLCLTATPAPNDIMEFASQASFLEKMRTEHDIIWTFFTRDPETQKWTVRPHARRAFFEWMASWSIYVNNPKRFGWRVDQPDVPAPTYKTIDIEMTPEQAAAVKSLNVQRAVGQIDLFANASNGAVNRSKLSQIAKGFRYVKDGGGRRVERIASKKPEAIRKILEEELKTRGQVLIWTMFDEEVEILRDILPEVCPEIAWITGETPDDQRAEILRYFRMGSIRVLASRARMLGFGMNFEFCKAMIFSGWTDSFEDLYQAIRRAVRHGQKESVRIYFPIIRELEGDVFDNIRRKEAEFERAIAEMEDCYIQACAVRGEAP